MTEYDAPLDGESAQDRVLATLEERKAAEARYAVGDRVRVRLAGGAGEGEVQRLGVITRVVPSSLYGTSYRGLLDDGGAFSCFGDRLRRAKGNQK